jgi:hypothetical protein
MCHFIWDIEVSRSPGNYVNTLDTGTQMIIPEEGRLTTGASESDASVRLLPFAPHLSRRLSSYSYYSVSVP